MALIVILTISLLGATLTAFFFNVLMSSQTELDRTRALYLAEAGISKAISALKTEAGTPALVAGTKQHLIPPTRLGQGAFEVYIDFSQSTIVSVGSSRGVRRILQVKYNAF